jgi:hypothetical protein
MLKLYKRVDSELRYRESWSTGNALIEHWGTVGEPGDTQQHPLPAGSSEEDAILQVLRPALADGFEPWDEDEYSWLFVVYRTSGMTSTEALRKRHAAEDRLNHVLGWAGCGECDGGSTSRGTMEVACRVVDFDLAKRVIVEVLSGTEFGDYIVIGATPSIESV